MLEAREITAGYGKIPVLHEVSITIRDRGAVAILGPNGAGKSTLMKTLARQLPTMGGELVMEGDRYDQRNAQWATAEGIALVPQENAVFPDLTVLENLRLGATARKGVQGNIDEPMDRFPILRERAQQRAGSLSGGERQLLAVSCALLMDPSVLLLDEPTTGLAPMAAEMVAELITDVIASGTAVAWVVEQMPELALRRAEQVYLLNGGQIQFEGDPSELLEEGRLEGLMLQHEA
jgi:branched-chain amino acid transport system ATP-binding protein